MKVSTTHSPHSTISARRCAFRVRATTTSRGNSSGGTSVLNGCLLCREKRSSAGSPALLILLALPALPAVLAVLVLPAPPGPLALPAEPPPLRRWDPEKRCRREGGRPAPRRRRPARPPAGHRPAVRRVRGGADRRAATDPRFRGRAAGPGPVPRP